MADLSKPEEITAQQENSTSAQGAAQNDTTQQEPRGVGRAEVQSNPNANAQTTDNQKDPYEHLRTLAAIGALFVSVLALCVSFGSCYSSKRSADTAEQVFNITRSNERPWVSVEVEVPEPLAFSREGNLGMDIVVSIKNVGRSVALDVLTWVDLTFTDPNGSYIAALNWQTEQCGARRQSEQPSEYTPGRVLFPDVPAYRFIERVWKWAKEIKQEVARALPENKGKVGFIIVGCVSYRTASEDLLHRRHQTRFLYAFGRWDDQKFITLLKPQGFPDGIVVVRGSYGNTAD